MLRTYSELILLDTFEERFNYLKLSGKIGEDTFGFDRYLNQIFYRSSEWRKVRNYVIVRDNGCDLGLLGYEIYGDIIVHHMNPITQKDIKNITEYLLNPEYLISTVLNTHNALHYGSIDLVKNTNQALIERKPNDTCPWKK